LSGFDFTLEVDQKRGIKQRGRHGGSFPGHSSPIPLQPSPRVRVLLQLCRVTEHGSAQCATFRGVWRS